MTQRHLSPHTLSLKQLGISCCALGALIVFAGITPLGSRFPLHILIFGFGFVILGGFIYITVSQLEHPPGIRNNHIVTSNITARGLIGWIIGILLTGLYVILYWFPDILGHLIRIFDPLSQLLRGKNADQWFLYGTFYCLAVLVMGYRMLLKYRHSRYQVFRTSSVIFFQLIMAYLIPSLLQLFNQPEYYFSYFWPLMYNAIFPSTFEGLSSHPGGLGFFLFFWGVMMSFIMTPTLTYFFGKRWYCSWVCGCGGLANTLGDPWRQLSSKTLREWKIERWTIHSVLVFIVMTTLLLWINSLFGGAILGRYSQGFAKVYGFLVGSLLAGVVGVGFYPLLGSRVWCRFFCPQAAILGLLQKFMSRFRISTNGAQCISCGNCSKYCEMGIDVRWYAQRGQNIVRASCVGCGICSAVCPRGVLNLESGPTNTRHHGALTMLNDLKSR